MTKSSPNSRRFQNIKFLYVDDEPDNLAADDKEEKAA